MPPARKTTTPPKSGPISVSSKTLAHISRGLYRSTAGALKELASNAFDADATKVVITTNPPHFTKVTCRDDGVGWTLDAFEVLMTGKIGDSDKRVDGDLTPGGRRVIGRIGIGLLAVAQICHEFEIWSHHAATKTAFHGRVTIQDDLEREIDETSLDPASTMPIGEYWCEPIEFVPAEAGTTIVVTDVRRGFSLKHRQKGSDVEASQRVRPPRSYRAFLADCYQERTVKTLGDYWELIWGLSVQCPVTYMKDGPVLWGDVDGDVDLVRNLLGDLPSLGFEVLVDGVALHKPLKLPNRGPGGSLLPATLHYFEVDDTVYGSPLRARGYFLAQSKAVKPSELRGLLIRVRGVGIGEYDKTFMEYAQWAAGPRMQQVTGELYVHEGLEDALNIDRASFNEMHPHYLHLQGRVHDALTGVFKQLTERSRTRSDESAHDREMARRARVLSRLQEMTGRAYVMRPAPASQSEEVVVDARKGRIYVKEDDETGRGARKAAAIRSVLLAAALADAEQPRPDQALQRTSLLSELLREVL